MSRIADVLQKSREELGRRLQTEPHREALGLPSIGEIRVPWQLEDERTFAPASPKIPPPRVNPASPPTPFPRAHTPVGLAPAPETVDLARNLFLAGGAPRPRYVLFSAVDSGGASGPLAVRLALGLVQQTSGSICLLDLNLAGGTFHGRLQLDAGPGLSDAVLQGTPMEAWRQIVPFEPRLSFLAAGSRPRELRPLMRDRNTLGAIRTYLEAFDFVVAHGQPGATDDTAALGACFDGVVLVVETWPKSAQATLKAKAALKAAGVRLLGTVLTSPKNSGAPAEQ